MNKEAELELTPICARIVELKNLKEKIDSELKEAEATVKQKMNELSILADTVGKYQIELKKVAGGRVVDTAKLKADGLYDQYSKPKAGYDMLKVIDPDDVQGNERRDRQKTHSK